MAYKSLVDLRMRRNRPVTTDDGWRPLGRLYDVIIAHMIVIAARSSEASKIQSLVVHACVSVSPFVHMYASL